MEDENQNKDKDKFNKLLKSRIVLVIITGIVITILYFIMSPYQNCLRDTSMSERRCLAKTSW